MASAGIPVPVDLPPGMVLVDSPLVSMQRYIDGDFVRFYRGRPEKIGGNLLLSTAGAMASAPRGVCAWNDLTAQQWIAAGTATKLYALSNTSFTPIDITPTSGFTPGGVNPTLGFGWGAGTWSAGTWGTPRTVSTFTQDPLFWSVANFGKLLLASPSDGPLYVWDPTTVPQVPAALVTADTSGNSYPPSPAVPSVIRGFWVTAERFVICFGCNGPTGAAQNLMRLYWCAQGDYQDWNTAHTPSELAALPGAPAGSRQLTNGTRIMNGVDLGNYTSLVWTDQALYTLTYTGSQYTFDSQLAGEKCGLIARNAFCKAGSAAFWLSRDAFWMFSGGALQNIPNQDDVRAYVFDNIRGDNYESKTFAYFLPQFDEIWFCFCAGTSDEPNVAVVYNLTGQFWFKTSMQPRSGQVQLQGLANFGPIMFGADGNVYQHEYGVDNNSQPQAYSLTSGLMELQEGAQNVSGLQFFPDMERQAGDVSLTIRAVDRTRGFDLEDSTLSFGPTDKSIDYRVGGREFQLILAGGTAVGDDFRLGHCKLSLSSAGRRT